MGTLNTLHARFIDELRRSEAADLLHETFDEGTIADEKPTSLAEDDFNQVVDTSGGERRDETVDVDAWTRHSRRR
jgi:hypothetical protein